MGARFTRLLVFVHRWIGIVLCLFFVMWFFTGIVMMYVPFPSLSDTQRLGFLEQVDAQSVHVAPGDAIAMCGVANIDRVRVISLAQRPIYVCHGDGPALQAVYADVPGMLEPLSAEQVSKLARSVIEASFVVQGPIQYDQWIVHQKFDPYRPFYRLEVDDVQSTHLYVSAQTGELLQRTTGHARFWNYLGAVAHWIYPTILRKHWAWWDQTVWWLSLFGIVGATLGVYLGVLHLTKIRKTGNKRLSPFQGWMRWHHVLGLVFGLFILSWVFSGWLSMDHGRLFSVPTATAAQTRSVQGLSMNDIGKGLTAASLRAYANVREISLHAFAGTEIVVAKNANGVVDTQALNLNEVAHVISDVWSEAPILRYGTVPSRDTYTHLREGQLPIGTIRVELGDAGSTWVHVDLHSGEILSVVDRGRRVYRWLFNGMHSLDIPGLVERRPLWDVIMLLLLLGGLIGSLTGVVVGSKRLFKDFGW